ncbi:DUF6305 family protein [Virgibacillus sp. 179-BFC.A HS]|uniref:DUF6305 family protein n=1 Tax=Tigheibacillus jepli TaxID=3035914 RepID=A0ABU5CEL3_9BACI|nr:DUF6305 family protein [Virgibacillus sp. 179-BFC.A HS]MDY0404754.1 DUF6305 family protein [Virgibacillus sp. 179-BFC.A HS]
MQKYIPIAICFAILLILLIVNTSSYKNTDHVNAYPNLPAPIGKEKILVTSAGQAIEGAIVQSIAESLNLQADYRPRALASDLYDYHSVVVVLGYSANGLNYTHHTYEEELNRIRGIAAEAKKTQLPLIAVHLSGNYRDDKKTFALFQQLADSTDYFIALKSMNNISDYQRELADFHTPVTLISDRESFKIPFNAAFR